MSEAYLLREGIKHDLFEVDLGELKSMKENQLHINEATAAQIERGQQIVDDATLDA